MAHQLVAVVTGTSSGFGHDTVRELAAAGHRVYATMRDPGGRNAKAAGGLAEIGASIVELDVTGQHSVDEAAAHILSQAGRVDVLVNNAGTAHFGVAEAFTPESLERQFATNVVGPFRVARAFLPGMRANRSGLVIFVSSVLGRIVVPFTGVYTASKWAIEALAESLSYEVRPFGVDIAILEPGTYATKIFGALVEPDDRDRLASYGDVASTSASIEAAFAKHARDPHAVAQAIAALVAAPARSRPLRTVIPARAPAAAINTASAPIQRRTIEAFGLEALLPNEASL
jgi:NAD(P)-dependent dehydrogenase (short-subunit alcohol dehydrogenase family)